MLVTRDRPWIGRERRQFLIERQWDEQAQPHPDRQYSELGGSGAELDDRNVFVTVMVLVAAMPMIQKRVVVGVAFAAMTVGALAVYVRALWSACVTVGIDVHVQSAQLRGQQTHAG